MREAHGHMVRHDIVHNQNSARIRQLCRDINNRAGDRERLQSLVIQLQTVLAAGYEIRAGKLSPQRDNPFDKIMVC
jgi:hypothetical protein